MDVDELEEPGIEKRSALFLESASNRESDLLQYGMPITKN